MKIIRWLLTGVLLYFVYGETGPATTISLFLVFLMSEVLGGWARLINQQIILMIEAERVENNDIFRL